ncbi:hypothetical protein ACFLZ2_05945, partial [Candidatus Margulisiibacteriota bacterium]
MSVEGIKERIIPISDKALSPDNVVLLKPGKYPFEVYQNTHGKDIYVIVEHNKPSGICLSHLAKIVGGTLTKDNLIQALKEFQKTQKDLAGTEPAKDSFDVYAIYLSAAFAKERDDAADIISRKLELIYSGKRAVRTINIASRKAVVVKERTIDLGGGVKEKSMTCDFTSRDLAGIRSELLQNSVLSENTEPAFYDWLEAQGGVIDAKKLAKKDKALSEENAIHGALKSDGIAGGSITNNLVRLYAKEKRAIEDFWADPSREIGALFKNGKLKKADYDRISNDVKGINKLLERTVPEKILADTLQEDLEKAEYSRIKGQVISGLSSLNMEERRRAALILACMFMDGKNLIGISEQGMREAVEMAVLMAQDDSNKNLQSIIPKLAKEKINSELYVGGDLSIGGVRRIVLELVYAYQYAMPYQRAQNMMVESQRFNEIKTEAAEEDELRLSTMPADYPIVALKTALRAMGLNVSDPSVNGLTPNDIRIIARVFGGDKYRLNLNKNTDGLLSLWSLRKKLDIDPVAEIVLEIVVEGGATGQEMLSLAEYGYVAEIGKALLKLKEKNGNNGLTEKIDSAIEAVSYVYPKAFWYRELSRENNLEAVKRALILGSMDRVQSGVDGDKVALLKRVASYLEDPKALGAIGQVNGTGNLEDVEDADNKYVKEYNEALKVIREIIFPFTLYTISPSKKTRGWDVLPFRSGWMRGSSQKVKVNGADVSPQIMILKGIFFDAGNPTMFAGKDMVGEYEKLSIEEKEWKVLLEDLQEKVNKTGLAKFKKQNPSDYREYVDLKDKILRIQRRRLEIIQYLFSDKIDLRLVHALKKKYGTNIKMSQFVDTVLGMAIDIELPEKAQCRKDPWRYIENTM